MTKAEDLINYMVSLQDEEQRKNLMRFFKTGQGEYGQGDDFIGLKVPQTREIVKAVSKDMPITEVPQLLSSRWHEVRLCGLLVMVDKFEKSATKRLVNHLDAIHQRDALLTLYLQEADRANNWDLVDLSAPKILGHWLLLPTCIGGLQPGMHEEEKEVIVDTLASSDSLWRNRISMVCTWKTTQEGNPTWCLRYAEKHLHHPHDLMHKAVGWMLRELGKRISMDLLRDFLHQHAHEMPRTALRYAIEQMPEEERRMWLTSSSPSVTIKS